MTAGHAAREGRRSPSFLRSAVRSRNFLFFRVYAVFISIGEGRGPCRPPVLSLRSPSLLQAADRPGWGWDAARVALGWASSVSSSPDPTHPAGPRGRAVSGPDTLPPGAGTVMTSADEERASPPTAEEEPRATLRCAWSRRPGTSPRPALRRSCNAGVPVPSLVQRESGAWPGQCPRRERAHRPGPSSWPALPVWEAAGPDPAPGGRLPTP